MPAVLFITHAEVQIDPAIPVPRWPLSALGRDRHDRFAASPAAAAVTAIRCSSEQKAIDGATILAKALGLAPVIIPALHENDRSATGYLPHAAFEATADLFFAHPDQSVRGWERAVDAQARIVRAVGTIMRTERTGGDIAIVAHGGVGALLLCHVMGVPIARTHDQPGTGGGNYFAFSRTDGRLIHGWRSIGAK